MPPSSRNILLVACIITTFFSPETLAVPVAGTDYTCIDDTHFWLGGVSTQCGAGTVCQKVSSGSPCVTGTMSTTGSTSSRADYSCVFGQNSFYLSGAVVSCPTGTTCKAVSSGSPCLSGDGTNDEDCEDEEEGTDDDEEDCEDEGDAAAASTTTEDCGCDESSAAVSAFDSGH